MSMCSNVNFISPGLGVSARGPLKGKERHSMKHGLFFKNYSCFALHGQRNQQINANCSIRPKCQIKNGAFYFVCMRACVTACACVPVV